MKAQPKGKATNAQSAENTVKGKINPTTDPRTKGIKMQKNGQPFADYAQNEDT